MSYEYVCQRASTCQNHGYECHRCMSMNHFTDPYPCYKEIEPPVIVKTTTKVKIFDNMYAEVVEHLVNNFIQDKEVIDIQYQRGEHDHNVLIIYKED